MNQKIVKNISTILCVIIYMILAIIITLAIALKLTDYYHISEGIVTITFYVLLISLSILAVKLHKKIVAPWIDKQINNKTMLKTKLKKLFTTLTIIILLIASVIIIKDEASYQLGYYNETTQQKYCSIMGVTLSGELTTMATYDTANTEEEYIPNYTDADYITYAINDMESNPNVKAIILEIESIGGSSVAAEEIANALLYATKPTVAQIRDHAYSAGYWAATGADYIIASEMSDIGNIGVNGSYLDYSKQNTTNGITYNQLTSAPFKNIGDPDKPLTEDEKELLQRDIDIMHQYFVKSVAENRGLDIDKVNKLADGSTMLGRMALDNGLIDEIGDWDNVLFYLEDVDIEYDDICWYE